MGIQTSGELTGILDDDSPVGDAAREWLAAFGAAGDPQAPFRPKTLKQALDGALELGRAADRLPDAMRVLADIELRLGAVGARLGVDRRAGTVAGAPAPRVAIVSAVNSVGLTLAGRWAPDLAGLAGAEAVLAPAGGPDLAVTPAAVGRAGVEVVILALPATTPADAMDRYAEALRHESWRVLAGTRVVALDGTRFVTVPGPATARSVELIAAVVHGPVAGVTPADDEIQWLEPGDPGNALRER